MCFASSEVLLTHRLDSSGSLLSSSRIWAFARMTASGVLSSCEASETNLRWSSQARLTGLSAHPESR